MVNRWRVVHCYYSFTDNIRAFTVIHDEAGATRSSNILLGVVQ